MVYIVHENLGLAAATILGAKHALVVVYVVIAGRGIELEDTELRGFISIQLFAQGGGQERFSMSRSMIRILANSMSSRQLGRMTEIKLVFKH